MWESYEKAQLGANIHYGIIVCNIGDLLLPSISSNVWLQMKSMEELRDEKALRWAVANQRTKGSFYNGWDSAAVEYKKIIASLEEEIGILQMELRYFKNEKTQ